MCLLQKEAGRGSSILLVLLVSAHLVVGGAGQLLSNVPATRHGAYDSGACELPSASYSVQRPVALGDIGSLEHLKYQPALCGHVLEIDCGHGAVDVIVSNSNLGNGLDLYGSTWDQATENAPPGVTQCSVQLSNRNAFNFDDPRCYYAPTSEKHNQSFRMLGVFNTGSRLVTGATFNGQPGSFNGPQPYFAFQGPLGGDASVVFTFNDGSNFEVNMGDCIAENDPQMWN